MICPTCNQLTDAIYLTVENCRIKGKFNLADDLEAILTFLPESPVFAILEAESR
jgi:hypothetical protein